jgi:hypothetical protein
MQYAMARDTTAGTWMRPDQPWAPKRPLNNWGGLVNWSHDFLNRVKGPYSTRRRVLGVLIPLPVAQADKARQGNIPLYQAPLYQTPLPQFRSEVKSDIRQIK